MRYTDLGEITIAPIWSGSLVLRIIPIILLFAVPCGVAKSFSGLGEEIVTSINKDFFDSASAQRWTDRNKNYYASISTRKEFVNKTQEILSQLGTSHTGLYPYESLERIMLTAVFEDYFRAKKAPIGNIRYSSLGIDFVKINKRYYVRHIFAGSAAEQVGLLRGDEILTINGKVFSPQLLLRNPRGKSVALEIRRKADASAQIVSISPKWDNPRKEWLTAQRASTRLVSYQGKRIGYQHIFSCAGEENQNILRDSIANTFQASAQALIVDLRDGWGGCNPEFLDLFNPLVPAITTKLRDASQSTYLSVWKKPLIVLINEGSRSGKELVAYSIQRQGLGTLVGATTAGAVMAGRPKLLGDGSILYVAIGKILIEGHELEGLGVTPDIVVADSLPYAAGRDLQFERALEISAIQILRNENEKKPLFSAMRPSKPSGKKPLNPSK